MSVIVVMLRMLDQAAGRVPASIASVSNVIEASAILHKVTLKYDSHRRGACRAA